MGDAARKYEQLDEIEHDHVVTFRDASWAHERRLVELRGAPALRGPAPDDLSLIHGLPCRLH